MTKLLLGVAALGLAALITAAGAAAAARPAGDIAIIYRGPAATAINCPIAYPKGLGNFEAPLAAGTLIAHCAMQPAAWRGALALSGPDAGYFKISGDDVVVGRNPITVTELRTYHFTVTPEP